ncbi:MAG: prenyltransferase [Oceanospirillaceae bacterium]|nr:prenyltransferase [Oceanospirillaceae bacterium]|tara:strand:+ start:15428 stop:16312 length:885 start_codon:yes stop_codon:yes gene_type:complete
MQAVIQSARGPFLILTPMCVLAGVGAVVAQGGHVSVADLLLVLLGALSAHISVNALNEYLDFRSGIDLHTRRTPFSGGSGGLPEHPHEASGVLMLGIVTLAITILVGLYFLLQGEYGLLPLGLAGVIIIVAYTRHIHRSPWLCLIAPGFGFGLAMVAGTGYALGASDSPTLWLAALVPFFLVNNLLLLNQYPDIEADRAGGRRHFPIAYGVKNSTHVFALNLLAVAVVLVLGVVAGWFPRWSLLALIALLPGVMAWRGAVKMGADIGQQPQFMAANVVANLLTPAVLGLTLILA